jgi:DNA-binding NtrC family response regulator
MPTTIMIVNEALLVRKVVRLALKGSVDAVFLEANDAAGAFEIAREYRGPINLLVSDVLMSGRMTGIDFATTFCDIRPETKVLLLAGDAPDGATMKHDWQFILKPFALSEVRESVGNILAQNYRAAC